MMAFSTACGGSTASGTGTHPTMTDCTPGRPTSAPARDAARRSTCASDGRASASAPARPSPAGSPDTGMPVRPQGCARDVRWPRGRRTLTDTNDFNARTISISRRVAPSKCGDSRSLGWSDVGLGGRRPECRGGTSVTSRPSRHRTNADGSDGPAPPRIVEW
jgi:hypothetical protein